MSTMSGTAIMAAASKRAGIFCGWLTVLFIGTACFYVGMSAFASRVAPTLHVYTYPEGRCTIQFIRPLPSWRHNASGPIARYIIVYSFTVHTAGDQDYQVVGAGMGSAVVSSSAEVQNMVNSYHQGGVYPCWYNPSDPSHVVLYRNIPVLSFAWCSAFAALGLLIMLKALTHMAGHLSFLLQSTFFLPLGLKRWKKKKFTKLL
jgi:hypothetical protein